MYRNGTAAAKTAGRRAGPGGTVLPRTQESVAVSPDGSSWFLLNVSPEIRAQLESFPSLWPRDRRHSPVSGLLLTNGDLDHCLGLLSLRESYPLVVYATESVRDGFTSGNVLYRTLERFADQVTWRTLAVGREQAAGRHAADRDRRGDAGQAAAAPGRDLARRRRTTTSGWSIRDSRTEPVARLFLGRRRPVAGAGPRGHRRRPGVLRRHVLVQRRAHRAGARARGAPKTWRTGRSAGRTAACRFCRACAARRILIHINNTNPMLREGSPEQRAVHAAGIEVARRRPGGHAVSGAELDALAGRGVRGAPAGRGRPPLPRPAPVPSADARRRAEPRASCRPGR